MGIKKANQDQSKLAKETKKLVKLEKKGERNALRDAAREERSNNEAKIKEKRLVKAEAEAESMKAKAKSSQQAAQVDKDAAAEAQVSALESKALRKTKNKDKSLLKKQAKYKLRKKN